MKSKGSRFSFVVVLAVIFAGCGTLLKAEPIPSSARPASIGYTNEGLRGEILKLFSQDQGFLNSFENAKKDQAFAKVYNEHKERVLKHHSPNFYDLAVYELWAAETNAPENVVKFVEFRKTMNARLKTIIADNGWPRRSAVGDEAAAAFFFLFGHGDDDNAWRRTQLNTIREICQKDHVNPRLYAHLVDRIETIDQKPQVFGSVMGPGKEPGSAKLYSPLIDNVEAANKRRAEWGLPSIEEDLEAFRKGAKIGPYMTPVTKEWTMEEVYKSPSSGGRSSGVQ